MTRNICTVLLYVHLSALFSLIWATDAVYVKNGTVVQGDIIAKSTAIVKIFVESYQRPIAIEKSFVDSIEYRGKIYTFETLTLEEKTDYNPAFKVSPIVRKVNPRARHELFAKDPFEAARKNNVDLDSRKQNLLFNAPVRWGSAGMGYSLSNHMSGPGGNGFNYGGEPFDIRSIALAMRYNLGRKAAIPGTIAVEFGYGKAHVDTQTQSPEVAIMSHVSFRYIFCNPKWLLSPGISAGILMQNGSLIRTAPDPSLVEGKIVEMDFDGSSVMLFVGFDLNLYDVIAFHVSHPFFSGDKDRLYASLMFLIPFRL
ncbi:MAG: hypothetical protein JNL74_19190 [Fibrobacteres bacterium]|nr:hypothetical protein [Fibrobacterota bacterium]